MAPLSPSWRTSHTGARFTSIPSPFQGSGLLADELPDPRLFHLPQLECRRQVGHPVANPLHPPPLLITKIRGRPPGSASARLRRRSRVSAWTVVPSGQFLENRITPPRPKRSAKDRRSPGTEVPWKPRTNIRPTGVGSQHQALEKRERPLFGVQERTRPEGQGEVWFGVTRREAGEHRVRGRCRELGEQVVEERRVFARREKASELPNTTAAAPSRPPETTSWWSIRRAGRSARPRLRGTRSDPTRRTRRACPLSSPGSRGSRRQPRRSPDPRASSSRASSRKRPAGPARRSTRGTRGPSPARRVIDLGWGPWRAAHPHRSLRWLRSAVLSLKPTTGRGSPRTSGRRSARILWLPYPRARERPPAPRETEARRRARVIGGGRRRRGSGSGR